MSTAIKSIIPGKTIITGKFEVISICSKRITANDVLNIFILRIWKEMAILFKSEKQKKSSTGIMKLCHNIFRKRSSIKASVQISYRMTRFELRRCPQTQNTPKCIRPNQHSVTVRDVCLDLIPPF